MASDTDRIRKQILLRAPIERVWRAVSDSRQFGAWFGVEFDGPFEAQRPITGKIAPTRADATVAKLQEPYAGKRFDFTVDRIEGPHLIAFRWHPFAMEAGVDYSSEPTTLIVFELAEEGPDTRLTITESGFDGIPLARRAKAFEMNAQGWTAQLSLIQKYLAHAS